MKRVQMKRAQMKRPEMGRVDGGGVAGVAIQVEPSQEQMRAKALFEATCGKVTVTVKLKTVSPSARSMSAGSVSKAELACVGVMGGGGYRLGVIGEGGYRDGVIGGGGYGRG